MSYNPQNPNGQATSANSEPVVIASDQSAIPVSASSLPLPTGAATSADQTNGTQKTQVVDGSGNVIGSTSNALNVNIAGGSVSGTTNVTQVGGSVIALGNANMSASLPVTLASNDTNTAPFVASGGGGYVRQDSTSTIAKESGGNLAVIAGAVSSSKMNVNLASGSTMELTDGTNTANVIAPGTAPTGQNAILTAPSGYSTTTNLTSGTPASSWYDCLNYPWISVEILSNSSAATLTFQTSGDASETNIRTSALQDSQNTASASSTSTSSAIASLYGPRTGRYFRVSSNLTGVNTASLAITFYTSATSLASFGTVISGTAATGTTVPANALYIGGNSGGNLSGIAAVTNPADATTNNSVSLVTLPFNMVYNGTNWDRMREAGTATGTSGTGLLGTGSMGVYNTSAPTASNGDYYPLQLDNNANLKVNVAAGSGLTIQPGNTPNTTPWLMSLNPATSGGWSVSSQTALTNTVVAVKTSAGQLGGYMFYNPGAGVTYIQVFNAITSGVTLGTTAPTYVIPIPGGGAANVEFANGIAHSAAISLAATTTATGASAPASALTGFVLYK